MKKAPALLLLLLSFAPALAAQAPADWVKVSPPGRFTVLMPTQPTPEVKTTDHPKSGPFTTHLYISRSDGTVYVVGWVDYDPKFNFNVQAELEANRDNLVKGIKAKLLSTTPIKLGDHPGIEFAAEMLDAGAASVKSRVYIVGRRPYQLITLTPAGRDSTRNVERFFSSFELAQTK